MEAEPKLAEALVTALASRDVHAARCQAEIGAAMAETLSLAFPDDFDPATEADITRTLGHVWFSSLVGWVNNWFGITKAADELEIACPPPPRPVRLTANPRPQRSHPGPIPPRCSPRIFAGFASPSGAPR